VLAHANFVVCSGATGIRGWQKVLSAPVRRKEAEDETADEPPGIGQGLSASPWRAARSVLRGAG
jgi:hypothetical protein